MYPSRPTGRPDGPGRASTTSATPWPMRVKKIGRPPASVPLGSSGTSSARAKPKWVIDGPSSGPGVKVGVGVELISGVDVDVGWLGTGVPVKRGVEVPGTVPVEV